MYARPQTPQVQSPSTFFSFGMGSPIYSQSPISQASNLVKKLSGSQNDRIEAMYTLSSQREMIPNLGALIWESPAAVAALLSEIVAAFPHLASISTLPASTYTSISQNLMNRVCNAMTLFQSIAANDEVRDSFLRANLPLYLFPFLHTTSPSRECEHFKVAALGVIGTIAMADPPDERSNSLDVIDPLGYLLDNDFLPLCLRILKFGQEIHRILAAYILQRILSTQKGRESLLQPEKLKAVITILNMRVIDLAKSYNPRLSRNVCKAYEYVLMTPNAIPFLKQKVNFEELSKIEKSPKWDEKFQILYTQLTTQFQSS